MRMHRSFAGTLLLGLAALAVAACSTNDTSAPAPATTAAATAATASNAATEATSKIPITTKSPEAKAEYVAGRDQSEKLLVTDSIAHFQKAISLDPGFALAELGLANSAPTGKEFFDHLAKAVALADKVSNGERLMILATQAGANGDAVKQKALLAELVAAFPNDQRARFALGSFDFARQDFAGAIEELKKATEIDPSYSTAYNMLGYAYRQNGDYASAEKAFQKYVELIPKDPNPHDSYGELLLKMGRFDDSIAEYRKALAIDADFLNAHQGIAMALTLSGKVDAALAEIEEITKKARNEGEKRMALFARTVIHVDAGKLDAALADLDEQIALGEKSNDAGAIGVDRGLKGLVYIELGKPDLAKAEFDRGFAAVQASSLPQEVKDNNAEFHHYNLALVALAKKDVAGAKSEAEACRKGASEKNPNQAKLAHEIAGIVALDAKDWDTALAELGQANQQDPRNLYRECEAEHGKGDAAKAKDLCEKAANFNSLPQLNYAFVRAKAKARLEGKG